MAWLPKGRHTASPPGRRAQEWEGWGADCFPTSDRRLTPLFPQRSFICSDEQGHTPTKSLRGAKTSPRLWSIQANLWPASLASAQSSSEPSSVAWFFTAKRHEERLSQTSHQRTGLVWEWRLVLMDCLKLSIASLPASSKPRCSRSSCPH